MIVYMKFFMIFSVFSFINSNIFETTAVSVDYTDGEEFLKGHHENNITERPGAILFTAPYKLCEGECISPEKPVFVMQFPLFVGKKGKDVYKKIFKRDFQRMQSNYPNAPFKIKKLPAPWTLSTPCKTETTTTSSTTISSTSTSPPTTAITHIPITLTSTSTNSTPTSTAITSTSITTTPTPTTATSTLTTTTTTTSITTPSTDSATSTPAATSSLVETISSIVCPTIYPGECIKRKRTTTFLNDLDYAEGLAKNNYVENEYSEKEYDNTENVMTVTVANNIIPEAESAFSSFPKSEFEYPVDADSELFYPPENVSPVFGKFWSF